MQNVQEKLHLSSTDFSAQVCQVRSIVFLFLMKAETTAAAGVDYIIDDFAELLTLL